jgi:hypothetical protein
LQTIRRLVNVTDVMGLTGPSPVWVTSQLRVFPNTWIVRARLRKIDTEVRQRGYHMQAVLSYSGSMQFVAEAILPTYLEALQRALDNAVQRLPQGAPRRILTRLRRRLTKPDTAPRFESLHRLATLGEAQGWLSTHEAITIRKLAYRCSFYLRRVQGPGPENPS